MNRRRCARYGGYCTTEEIDTEEGDVRLQRCVNCGARYEPLINRHHRHRPEPYASVGLPVYVDTGVDDALE